MRVLHIMAGAPAGGAETFFLEAVLALQEAGVTQAAVTRGNSPFRREALARHGIDVTIAAFNRLWRFPTERAISNAIERFKPDVIHYWMGRAGSFARPRAIAQIGWYGGYYPVRRFQHCDLHLAITDDIVRHIAEQGVPRERIARVHVLVSPQPAPPVARATFDTPEGVPLLLALSRLHEKKGLDVLLKAMAAIEGAYLWLAGDGPLKAELQSLTHQLGLEDRVRFLGWRNDRSALLAAANVCVLPSRYEPFGAVILDAWAARTPLVAAAAQGPKAYVAHESDGLLVPPDDVDALAAALRRVVNEPRLAEQLTANGYAKFAAEFAKPVYQRNMLALYERAAALRRK